MHDQHLFPEAAELQAELNRYTGETTRFRNACNRRVIYTRGVMYLAYAARAFWLVDTIALHLASKPFREATQADRRIAQMHFWRLSVDADRSAELIAEADSGVAPFIREAIPYTDFPLPSISIWAAKSGRHWTLYLPSEH